VNSPEHTAARGIEPPRRPFLVALSLTLLVAAVQWTPPFRPLETRQAGSLVMARAVGMPFRIPARPDSAALERHVMARFEHLPLARFFFSRTGEREFSDRLARAIVK
jgi:hypothetical protein